MSILSGLSQFNKLTIIQNPIIRHNKKEETTWHSSLGRYLAYLHWIMTTTYNDTNKIFHKIPIETTQIIIRKCSPALIYFSSLPLKTLQFTKKLPKDKSDMQQHKKVDTSPNLFVFASNNVGFPETTTCACDNHFLFS